ncbi:MAG: entry exclusion 1 domain-containing protein [Micavibrio sp.]
MAKVGAQRAAELTGRSKSTIQRAMNVGKLSYETDLNGRRVVDVSELDRAFGLIPQGVGAGTVVAVKNESVEAEIKRATDLMEIERMKMRIKMLEDQLDLTKDQLEDTKTQRDQWQKQAQQVLLTSQYSQKQAEDLKAELVERDRRAKMRRQHEIETKMKRLKGQNENAGTTKPAVPETKPAFDIQGLWQKIRGEKKAA